MFLSIFHIIIFIIFCHIQTKWGEIIPVPAALGGKVVEIVAKQGKQIRRGDTIAWIEREK